jgi:hypothetical protein
MGKIDGFKMSALPNHHPWAWVLGIQNVMSVLGSEAVLLDRTQKQMVHFSMNAQ